MKAFTVRRDEVTEGITVHKGDNNDYYIRLSNTSYPESVRRYLNRNSPPEIKNNFVYDLSLYYDKTSNRTFLCKPVSVEKDLVIVLLKHNQVDKLKGRYIIFKEKDLPYMLIVVPRNRELSFISKDENDEFTRFRMYLDNNLKLHSSKI